MGFVVAERCVLTCAHVVNLALGRNERAQERPGERDVLYLEFPLAVKAIRQARVEQWLPPPASGIGGEDIAGLVIIGEEGLPPGVAPAQLSSDPPVGHEVKVFGYPNVVAPRPAGVWARGRVVDEVGGGSAAD